MLEQFKDHAFRAASLDQTAQANAIIEECQAEDLTLTSLNSKGREAGFIPWNAIEDRGRHALKVSGESDPLDEASAREETAKIHLRQIHDRWRDVVRLLNTSSVGEEA